MLFQFEKNEFMSDVILDDFSEENEVEQLHPFFRVYLVALILKIAFPVVLVFIIGLSSIFVNNVVDVFFTLLVLYIFVNKIFHQRDSSNRILYLLYFFFFFGTSYRTLTTLWLPSDLTYLRIVFDIPANFMAWIGAILLPLYYHAQVYNRKSAFGFLKYPVWLTVPFYFVGMWFKIQSWPYASELLTIGTMLFVSSATVAFIVHQVQLKREKLFANTILFLAAILFVVGFLFKIQMWPYAAEILRTAAGLIILRIILVFTISSSKEPN